MKLSLISEVFDKEVNDAIEREHKQKFIDNMKKIRNFKENLLNTKYKHLKEIKSEYLGMSSYYIDNNKNMYIFENTSSTDFVLLSRYSSEYKHLSELNNII